MERILTIFAFLVLCGFLGVLAFKLARLDLSLVIGITVAMTFYDLFIYKRKAR